MKITKTFCKFLVNGNMEIYNHWGTIFFQNIPSHFIELIISIISCFFLGRCCAQSGDCLNKPPLFLYIQMQLCKQETLKDWLVKRSPVIDYSRSLEIFLQIRDAVEYFHKQGMMHRDLKVILFYLMHTRVFLILWITGCLFSSNLS